MNEPDLLPLSALKRETTTRLQPDVKVTISPALREEYEAEGWVLDTRLKRSLRMRRRKRHDIAFEDRVWAMCARLGFTALNRGRDLRIPYGNGGNELKQIDVLAADDEVVLVIECKSSGAERPPTEAFKTEIEAIQGYRAGVIGTLRKWFPEHKVKFVFATNNIVVSEETQARIANAGIAYLDEEAVSYYHELADHLGVAAKFQLLGNIFGGTKIEALDDKVPAIEGRMGRYLYYSFLIEPERLLKVSYVLHRNNANRQWMPTYQRIIKKSRLKRVAEFVEGGGYFPNSLVLNIDSGGKKLRFERAATSAQSGESTMGILHLPQRYQSAYVIDGQHRLYGFAGSPRAASELVPVVAFVDLPHNEQTKIFMQINENQQAVPKNLRNTLEADLLWASDDLRNRARALKSKIAQELGERKSSPLRGRVIIGEERSTNIRSIGLEAISRGIDRGRFIGSFTAKEMKEVGSFWRGSNDATWRPLLEFLEHCFGYLSDELKDQWNIGRAEGGFIFTNDGVDALLRFIGDAVDHVVDAGLADPRKSGPEDVFVQVRELLKPLVQYIRGLTFSEGKELRALRGSGAPAEYHHRFQAAVADVRPNFAPAGLEEWKSKQEKQFNTRSYEIIYDIEGFLKEDIRRRLQDKYGSTWWKTGVPDTVFQEANKLATQKKWQSEDGADVDWWDCLVLSDYHKILLHGTQAVWNELFDDTYTLLSEGKATSWKSKSSWMDRVIKIRNSISHGGSAAEDDYEFLVGVHTSLGLGGTGRND
jgi:DNA sulfur modification protein DndB